MIPTMFVEPTCGWCGSHPAIRIIWATPTCGLCAPSRAVRVRRYHERLQAIVERKP
jgi:hypothetical protein